MIVHIFARARARTREKTTRFFGSAIDSSARFLPSQVPSQPADLPTGLFSSSPTVPPPFSPLPGSSRTIFQEISVQYGTAPIHRRAAYETHVRTRSRGQAETVNPETRRGRCALLSSLTGQRTPLARARASAGTARMSLATALALLRASRRNRSIEVRSIFSSPPPPRPRLRAGSERSRAFLSAAILKRRW